MEIKKLVLGVLRTNCYIVIKDNECLIIDPAEEAEVIKENCQDYKVVGILVTHHHFDHVGALNELEKYYNLKHNYFDDGFGYEVIKTPGHAQDCLTFYFKEEKVMFSGDFLFFHTIGRCDLENSSIPAMRDSLSKISAYPDDIKVYPGHGKSTILGDEKPLFSSYFKNL